MIKKPTIPACRGISGSQKGLNRNANPCPAIIIRFTSMADVIEWTVTNVPSAVIPGWRIWDTAVFDVQDTLSCNLSGCHCLFTRTFGKFITEIPSTVSYYKHEFYITTASG